MQHHNAPQLPGHRDARRDAADLAGLDARIRELRGLHRDDGNALLLLEQLLGRAAGAAQVLLDLRRGGGKGMLNAYWASDRQTSACKSNLLRERPDSGDGSRSRSRTGGCRGLLAGLWQAHQGTLP